MGTVDSSSELDTALLFNKLSMISKSLVVGQVVSSSTDPDNSTSSDSTGVSFFLLLNVIAFNIL
jgi:hypothetical protein